MKILVTGATGFIGSHLTTALVDKGYDVRCLVRKTSNIELLKKIGVELVYGDINEPKSLEQALDGIDVVYHLAGVLGKWGVPEKLYWDVHVHGTKNMLEASQKHNVKKFIYCSTAGVTGPAPYLPQDESLPYNPSNIYETTKAEGEKLVLQYHRENGLKVVVVRPEFVYGPGDTHTLGLFRTIRKRMFILIDGGKAFLHPTYIDDLTLSFLLCLDNRQANGEVYLIAGERYITLKEFATIIAKTLDVHSPTIYIPKRLAFTLGAVTQFAGTVFKFSPPLTIPRVKTLCRSAPPWKDVFDNYVKNGGTLITIVSKDTSSTGKIIQAISLGKGRQIEVSGYPNATFNSSTWHQSADFWSGLYKKSINHFRLILLQILKYACIVLALVFVFLIIMMLFGKRKSSMDNAELKAVNDQVIKRSSTGGHALSGWFVQRKKHILVILLLLTISIFSYSGWMTGLQQDKIPSFEEGLGDISAITYDLNYIHEYHSFPIIYNSGTSSRPMDISSAYMRTPTEIIPVIFSLTFGLSPFVSTVMTFILCTFLFMLIIYFLVYKHTKKTLAALISTLLYLAGNSLLLNAIAQGSLRYMMDMFLIPLIFLAVDLAMNDKKWICICGMIASLLAYLWLLGNNALIGVICLSAAIAMWFFIYGYRKRLIKFGTLFIILIVGGLGYWLFISANANLFPSTFFILKDFAWNEIPNFIQALALNVAQGNGTNPLTIALGSNHLFTFIEFLPLVFAALAMIFNRKFIMLYLIGIFLILLAAAFYGPLALLYLHIPLIFRASGRTFLPVAALFFVFLGGIGFANCLNSLQRVKFKSTVFVNTVPVVFFIGIICLLLATLLLVVKPGIKSWKVPDDIKNAYASIPQDSCIFNLPIYGNDYYSLSSPQQNNYRGDVSVGWIMLYIDEYEVNKYQLKDAYAPPSDWEVPFMTKWYFNMIDQKMTQWNDTIGAVDLLNLAPDLQYLVVYTKIMPDSVLQSLNTSDQLQKTFDSPTMTVYKRINSIEQPVMESNKAFLLYSGSYQYSLPSLAALTNGQIPVLMGQTIDKLFSLDDAKDMQNLTVTTQDTTIADIATGYAIDNTKDKTMIDLAKTLKTTETNWITADFWQPALGQLAMSTTTPGVIHNTTFKVSGTGNYDIYVRAACNGQWRGNLEILLDGQNLGGNYSPADSYGYRWFQVTTANLSKGKHTLGFLNTEIQWIDVNAVAVLNHTEYTSYFQKYSQEFQNIVAGHDYLGIYEAEDSYTNLTSAAVSDNFSQDWANYPSGGWPSGQSVEIQPASDNAITIPIDIPVSGSYYVTTKQKGTCEMITDNLHILPIENRKSDTWNYVSYFVYLAKGTHILRFSNSGQASVWLDTVYISNQPMSQILDHENPKITITIINDGDYKITSSSNQPRYVTLMKSYFPLWKAQDSSGKAQTDFLTNGFLSGFYVSGKTYIIQFK